MNIPNQLTLFRIAISPIFMVLLLIENIYARLAALCLFVLGCLSDLLDGVIARRWGQETGFGKFMDPIADKLLISMALISFVALRQAAAWVVLVIVGREFLIMGLRTLVAYRHEMMESSWLAKTKTFLQMLAITAILCYIFLGDAQAAGWLEAPLVSDPRTVWALDGLLLLAMLLTVVSGLDYIYRNRWLILGLFRDNF